MSARSRPCGALAAALALFTASVLPSACRPSAARERTAARGDAGAASIDGERACESGLPGPADRPARLADTGLYADFASRTLAPGVLAFSPQYPLWTDGATKRRWILLPPGTSIDASDPDAWVFPVGTRVWKEFSLGRPVETRMLHLGEDGAWRYATYLWSEDGTDATLAPEAGVRAAATTASGAPFDVPSRTDCRACHEAGPTVVLGFSALQLSSDRDPLAPHAETPPEGSVDLAELLRRGLIRGLPRALADVPPRIAARSAQERAALGYLHSNCGMCHGSTGELAGLGLDLAHSLAGPADDGALATTLGRPSRFRFACDAEPQRIAPGDPEASVLWRRARSRQPLSQMPPLGTRAPDDEALALLAAWIRTGTTASDAGGPSDDHLAER